MSAPDSNLLSINTATVRAQWSAARDHRRLRAARHPRHRAVARPGRRDGLEGIGAAHPRCRPRAVRLLPRRHVSGARSRGPARRARRQQARGRRGADARRAVPGAGRRRAAEGSRRPVASKDLAGAREMVRDGIGELLEYARPAGMPLAIEPLHPMYAADRACVNTIAHANDLCDELGRRRRHRRRRLSRLVGSGAPKPRSSAPAATRGACSRFTSATGWCRPPTC